MHKIQCDKNIKKILERFFRLINADAEISFYSDSKSSVCILRSVEDIPPDFTPHSDFLIVNSDDKELIRRIKGIKAKIITCGLSTRSSVTLSSISGRNYVMCLQRSLSNLEGEKIAPFEMPFESCGKIFDEVSLLMIQTAALVCGANVSQLKKIYL